MRIVISQPMYFPWVGILEQVNLANIFVYYDDVQFSRGFFNRVRIRTSNGPKWLTVPIRKHHRDTNINRIEIDEQKDWREQHRNELFQSYKSAPYFDEMMQVANNLYSIPVNNLADLASASVMGLVQYFGLDKGRKMLRSSMLPSKGKGTDRLLSICAHLGAKTYITGHGALNYLDHEAFDKAGISVEYMNYKKMPYRQLHGGLFDPFVSALDLVANCGRLGGANICSGSVSWRELIL